MVNKYYEKKQRRASERSMWKVPKSFRRRKGKKAKKARDRYKNLSEEGKQKKA